MKAVRVSAGESESVRQKLLSGSALDKTRKLVKKNGFIEIPVTGSFNSDEFTFVCAGESPSIIQRKKHSAASLIFLKVRKNYCHGDGISLGK